MAMIGKVRRMHHRENKSVREIVRATSLSRNTVRKYLREGDVQEPQYRRRAMPTKLAPFVEAVKQALLADSHRPKKERRTAKALHQQCRQAHVAGVVFDDENGCHACGSRLAGATPGGANSPLTTSRSRPACLAS